MDPYFYLTLGIAAIVGIIFSITTRGILYATPDTDNALMVHAAAQSHKWRWLSDVHKHSVSSIKVAMKEWTIILLSIFQKIFRDKTTNWPYTAMTGLAVSTCTVLIYLIASNYFNPTTGFIVAILYIVSFWPWQISLYGGHVNVANLFFLLSIYSIQISSETAFSPLIAITFGGAFLGFCLFSSPSSHKYFLAVFATLFFNSYRGLFTSHDINMIINTLPANHLLLLNGIIVITFLVANLFILSYYKRAVKSIYHNEAPDFLNKMMSGRNLFTLEHYIDSTKQKILKLRHWTFWMLFAFVVAINTIPASILLSFTAGFIFVFLLINLPNIKENVVEYFACMLIHKRRSHFKYYIDKFARIGITVNRTTRGAGLSWVPKMLWIFAPFHTVLFVTIFTIGQYGSISIRNMFESISLAVIAFIALSPIIWAEITGAPQVSRTYSPGLITSLLLPAYVISGIVWTTYSIILISGFIIITFAWNLWRFLSDVYPSRMTVRNFIGTVRRLGINDIYTYQTALNTHFTDAVPGIGKSEYLPKPEQNIIPPFRVHYIHRLDEVKNGWIAIPGTNRIAMVLTETINDDYTKDPTRNHLIETKQMDKLAEAKLKTYSTSAVWPHEDEVTSYCVLYLKNEGSKNPYRGYAWLVHSSKLSSNF
ncbi:MAG: hypothetical protein Q8R55_01955 [Candidatus Taylorbacteria bacterium]|nr:hypothetical protein [Candidatus Taylorbacteria bacterium]